MIEVRGLTKRFGAFTAVDSVTFEVRPGEVFAFLGPNGSGKTTTLKSIVGLVRASGGSVRVSGHDVETDGIAAKRQMSYLPQRVVFHETLTAREVIRFYAALRSLPAERAEAVLEESGLRPMADKSVQSFSGGMVQRLGLAVAALPDAPILLLDEPTANLDPEGVKQFREFVLAQKKAGKTVVFSTHLLAEAELVADRVAIFVGGRLRALESVEALRATFQQEGTIEDVYLHYVGEGYRAA